MEVNKDEALRCLDIARRHLLTGNFASARKFGQKSISLFPTSDARAFISLVDAKETAANNSNASSSTSSSASPSSTSRTGGTSTSTGARAGTGAVPPLNRSKSTPIPDHKPVERDYTPEQVAAVKAIRSSGGDFYKVLGVKKDATDIEIKKAYRKVSRLTNPTNHGVFSCVRSAKKPPHLLLNLGKLFLSVNLSIRWPFKCTQTRMVPQEQMRPSKVRL